MITVTDDGDGVVLAAVTIAVAITVVVIVVVAVAAATTEIAVVHVTALFGTLKAIVVLLGGVTTSRETIAQIGATTTLGRISKHYLMLVRLLSHFLQVLEGAENFLVEHVALLARVIGRSHVGRASHHRHAVHLLAYLDHDLRTRTRRVRQSKWLEI